MLISSTKKFVNSFIYIFAMMMVALPSYADQAFVNPPVFTSQNGMLDIIMIAKAQEVPSILFTSPDGSAMHPTGWVYEICQRKDSIGNACPPNAQTSSDWGGVRLALNKGDMLKVRLVNRLPLQDKNKVSHYWNMNSPVPIVDQNGINLPLSETNLHTHGLVVQARAATPSQPSWGDDIYVYLFNPANGEPVQMPSSHGNHGAIVYNDTGTLDYEIYLPTNIPSGLDWYHSHIHGYSADGLAHGLAGLITIGAVGDYAFTGTPGPLTRFPESQVKYITLKDMQVLAQNNVPTGSWQSNYAGPVQFQQGLYYYPLTVTNGEVLDDQQDPAFCSQYPSSGESRQGSCSGVNNYNAVTANQESNYLGGRWYFPVNGLVYPSLTVNDAAGGEIWRISNYSSSATYKLELDSVSPAYPMIMQLISVDGVSIHVPSGTSKEDKSTLAAARYTIVDCPAVTAQSSAGNFPEAAPVCVKDFTITPGARAEVWVTYRNSDGTLGNGDGKSAIFKTIGITTGIPGGAGDPWPAIDLVNVKFMGGSSRPPVLTVLGDAFAANRPQGIFYETVPYAQAAPLPQGCAPLPAGTHRRIYYGLVNVANPNIFGAGNEIVDDQTGNVVGAPAVIQSFDPSNPFICLPLAAGQKPVKEIWDVVNLGTEIHNFHIHQTRFRTIQQSSTTQPIQSTALAMNLTVGAGIMGDTAPLQPAAPNKKNYSNVMTNQNGYCTINDWKSGNCTNIPAKLEIPFAELGEFVYHCHILEHEDSGMMAKIQVVAAPPHRGGY